MNGFVGRVPCDSVALISAQLENLGADDDVSIFDIRLESASKTCADNKIRAVAANGHLGGDPGAFLADAKRKQRDGLAAQRALMEIEMFLADDVICVGPTQDRAQFLTNGNEDGDHGSPCFT
jgi:hypothetical protein